MRFRTRPAAVGCLRCMVFCHHRATDELVSGKVVGSFLAPGSGIVRKANARIGIRFLSMPESAANAAKVQSIAPGAFYTAVKPSKRMPYIDKPTTMLGFDYLLLVGTHVGIGVDYHPGSLKFYREVGIR